MKHDKQLSICLEAELIFHETDTDSWPSRAAKLGSARTLDEDVISAPGTATFGGSFFRLQMIRMEMSMKNAKYQYPIIC